MPERRPKRKPKSALPFVFIQELPSASSSFARLPGVHNEFSDCFERPALRDGTRKAHCVSAMRGRSIANRRGFVVNSRSEIEN
jgi:hypothetical protein